MRTFLFLQGHPSRFSERLALELQQQGFRVLRINLCFGDWLFWRKLPAVNYRGRFSQWPGFLQNYLEEESVTDIIYYGDQKPYHRVAAKLAKQLDIDTYTYEFGYLRPDWITVERNGMSTFSHFPNDPQQIKKIAEHFDEPDIQAKYPYTKSAELTNEVLYHLSTVILRLFYPFYKADRYYNLFLEYVSGIPGLFREKANHQKASQLIDKLVKNKQRFFLVPLQLQCDAQLRFHSPYKHQRDVIQEVMQSFSSFASEDAQLIFKQHPLDNGWERWQISIKQLAHKYGIGSRVFFIEGGNLDRLLMHAAGCVLINSTVGLHAIKSACPVKLLGTALYDIKGLVHEDPLDSFWMSPLKPDEQLVIDLIKALAGTIQVKGNFFTEEGLMAAVPEIAKRLTTNTVNGFGAYVDKPPRLKVFRG